MAENRQTGSKQINDCIRINDWAKNENKISYKYNISLKYSNHGYVKIRTDKSLIQDKK